MDSQSFQFDRREPCWRGDHPTCGLPRVQCARRDEEGSRYVARRDLCGRREVEWQLTVAVSANVSHVSIRDLLFEWCNRVDEQPAKAAEEVDRGGDPKGDHP